MAGAVAVPVNARYRASELGFLVRAADLVLMVTTGRVADSLEFGERLVAALPSSRHADDPRHLSLHEVAMLRSINCLDPPCPSFPVSVADAPHPVGKQVEARREAGTLDF